MPDIRTKLENATEAYGSTLSYNALLKQRDDLCAAARKVLPYCDSTRHGRQAGAELKALVEKCEASE